MNETAGKVAARGVHFYRQVWIEAACQHGCHSVFHTTTAVTRSTAPRWNVGLEALRSLLSLAITTPSQVRLLYEAKESIKYREV